MYIFLPTFLNTGTTYELFRLKAIFLQTHIMSSSSQFFRTSTRIQSRTNAQTFLTSLGVTGILFRVRLVLEGKQEIPES